MNYCFQVLFPSNFKLKQDLFKSGSFSIIILVPNGFFIFMFTKIADTEGPSH